MDFLFWLAIGFIILEFSAIMGIKLVLKEPTEKICFGSSAEPGFGGL